MSNKNGVQYSTSWNGYVISRQTLGNGVVIPEIKVGTSIYPMI